MTSNRRAMAALLTANPEIMETGHGFDDLCPGEDLISVIVPSYHHEEFVEQAIRSVTRQTHRNIEIILIDDHSPDRTFEVALSALRAGGLPYCAVRRTNAGMDTNINTGILLAHGAWIAMLASDDLYTSNSLQVLLVLVQRDRAEVAVGPVDDVDRQGIFKASRSQAVAKYSRLSGDTLRRGLLQEHGSLMIQGMLISRQVFAKVGLLAADIPASDFDYLIRMASMGVRFAFTSETTALHRQTRLTLSREHIRRGANSHVMIARRHARSAREYRLGASTVLCEAGLNSFHYRYFVDAARLLAQSFFLAPLNALKLLTRRLTRRLFADLR